MIQLCQTEYEIWRLFRYREFAYYTIIEYIVIKRITVSKHLYQYLIFIATKTFNEASSFEHIKTVLPAINLTNNL